jgi:hypothetical protein
VLTEVEQQQAGLYRDFEAGTMKEAPEGAWAEYGTSDFSPDPTSRSWYWLPSSTLRLFKERRERLSQRQNR